MSKRLFDALEEIGTQLKETNLKLEKITALITAQQLLTECVAPDGSTRSAEECAEITTEAYSAALCLMGDLEQRDKEYAYQKSEFFIEPGESETKLPNDPNDFINSF